MKAPQSDQLADRGIEQASRLPGQDLRTANKLRDLGSGLDVFLAAGDRLVERRQLPGMPRVQLAMYAVEFPENPPDRFLRAHRIVVDNRDLDHGAEHVRTRAVFRRCPSCMRKQRKSGEQQRSLAVSRFQCRPRCSRGTRKSQAPVRDTAASSNASRSTNTGP